MVSPIVSTCLISFFNTRSGRFKWWDEFPMSLKEQLTDHGVDCHFFYKSRSPQSIFDKDEIRINPERSGDGSLGDEGWLFDNIWPIMEQYQQVIIHTHSYHPPFRFRKLINKHGSTFWVATEHRCPISTTSPLTRLYKVHLRRNHTLPDWYVGVSHATSESIRRRFGKSRVITIHNGIDLKNAAERKDWSKRKQSESLRYLFVNRLDKGKGVEVLVDAIPLILQRNRNFYLTIVGDGPYRNSVEKQLADCAASNIRFEGYRSDVEHFYSSHDVVLLPYTRPQGLSLISIEARSHGLPAIYTRMGGVTETRDKSNGIAMRDATPESLARAVEEIERSPTFAQLIDGCYDGLEYFGMNRMVREYAGFYLNLFHKGLSLK